MAQLRCSDVTLGYEGTAVMEHLSFSVSAGDYLYIVGEIGSGKTRSHPISRRIPPAV